MGKIVPWTLLWLLGFGLGSASISSAAMDDAYEKHVQSECGFTTHPKLCVQTLLGLGNHYSRVDIPFVLVNETLSETRLPTSNIAKFSYQLATPESHAAHLVRGTYICSPRCISKVEITVLDFILFTQIYMQIHVTCS